MNLVVQGATLAPATLETLRHAAGARRLTPLGPQAWRLDDAHHTLQLAALLRQHKLDCCASLDRPLNEYGLLVTDMDSTLIDIECIDELARLHGVGEAVGAITAAAMRGEIDFGASLVQRTALLAGLPETALARVYDERLALNPGAEQLLDAAHAAGLHTILVSGGFTYFTDRLQHRLGFSAAHANTLEIHAGMLTGRVTGPIIDSEAKAAILRDARTRLGLNPTQTLAIGDGANDVPMLREAGLAIAYHAKPALRAAADICLNHAGLDGVVHLFTQTPATPAALETALQKNA